jgi:hypothetical protein
MAWNEIVPSCHQKIASHRNDLGKSETSANNKKDEAEIDFGNVQHSTTSNPDVQIIKNRLDSQTETR